MKKLTGYEWIVLVLCTIFVLYCAVWFFGRNTTAPGWQVNTERSDASVSAPVQSDSSGADGLLEGEIINLNTATRSDLMRLPDIGPSRADAILAYRQEHGLFQTVDDLLNVHGIGPGTLEALRPYLSAE